MSKLFGENLRNVRKAKGLSTIECARQFGLSQPAWNFYELGSREPKLDLLTKICQFFDVPADVLLGLSDKALVSAERPAPIAVDIEKLRKTAEKLAKESATLSGTIKELKAML